MPWIYIPKGDVSIYGYIGDGLITAFLFLIAIVILLFQKSKSSFSKKVGLSLLSIYTLLFLIAFLKIYNFNFNKNNYGEINFLVSTVMAGTKQGIGIYVLFLSSLVSFIITAFGFSSKIQALSGNLSFKKMAITLVSLGFILWIYFQFFNQPSLDKTETALKKDFQEMYLAFQTNDFDKFITYIHPLIMEPVGTDNYKTVIKVAREYLSSQSISIKAAEIDTVLFTHNSLNNIQSIVKGKVVFTTPRGDSTVIQRTLCISENRGKKWYYFNTTDKSFKEVRDNFPYLHEDLSGYFFNE